MLRWFLLVVVSAFAALGSLTALKSPDWAPWRLAVLAGEFGHWLALGAMGVVAWAWIVRGSSIAIASATVAVGALAVGLLLKPSVQAWRIATALPDALTRAFGPQPIARAAFTPRDFFTRGPDIVPAETHAFSGDLALDFYRAIRSDRGPAPCVIVVHGGGWDSGDRTQLAHFNHWLARRGYAVAAISYRLAPRFQWPAQRDDTLAAIAWLKARAGELGLDPTRLVLFGRSAGGQIAEAVSYAANDPALRGVIALYAPSDMIFAYENAYENDVLKSPHLMRQFLGGTPQSARANYESASALHFTGRHTPPTLLLHGENDALVWHRHSVRLDARLTELGVPHVFVSLPWATHAFEFNLHGPGGQLTTFAVEWFLAAVTK